MISNLFHGASQVIPREQALKNSFIPYFNLTGQELNAFVSESSYYYLLNYKGNLLPTLYGRFMKVDKSKLKRLESVMTLFGPDSLIKSSHAELLSDVGVCKVSYGQEKPISCGHKAQLPVYIESTGELLCPMCFNLKKEDYIIGSNCFLLYQLPF